jgi:hypothetical protein
MWPFSYSRCATRMTCAEDQPSFRPASICSVEVVNGA